MELEQKTVKIKYLHGRPGAHYTHANFAKNVGADFEYIDFKYRWQDQQKNIFYIIYSWFYCAKNYTNRKLYDIFLVDGIHFPPVIMKYLFLKRKRQKIVCYMGSHTLYFLYAGKFSKLNTWLHKKALRSYDALICEGDMAIFFVEQLLKKKSPPVYKSFNGIPAPQDLSHSAKTATTGKKLLFIGSYDNAFRFDYKGVDIMLEAFDIAFRQDNELQLTLVGQSHKELLNKSLAKMDEKARAAVNIIDYTSDLEQVVYDHNIYLHCSRGDAFPTTVLIALSAGIPAIVNQLNGTREAVAKVDQRLVTGNRPNEIAAQINWLVNLPENEKLQMMEKCRQVSKEYTEEAAVANFKTIFKKIEQDLLPGKQ